MREKDSQSSGYLSPHDAEKAQRNWPERFGDSSGFDETLHGSEDNIDVDDVYVFAFVSLLLEREGGGARR